MSEELAAIRARLAGARGALYWRTLEEVADAPAFQALLAREYPSQAGAWLDPIRRRSFLKLMAAALALGGLEACRGRPRESIVPYVRAPAGVVPGEPLHFATAFAPTAGLGIGLLVESHLGRPIKVEGNPDHPASRGATDAFAQASILTLYDPGRLQATTFAGAIRPWTDFLAAFRSALGAQRARRGAGLRILTETVTSPALAAELEAVLQAYPEARWHQWEPAGRDLVRAGTLAAFGADVRPIHRLADADVVVALGADFLGCGPSHLADVRAFARRRRPDGPMNRFYAAETALTPTGAKADHRIAVRAADLPAA
ncbi:MAG TPA: TAT-variant-translocated molybdopterin oxidoreductase, partial [Candidatus Binatia bacterium]|nr:TAT-variant-translocated molybdopterin oxidoreductase [Candidatus Binatia bacterium]